MTSAEEGALRRSASSTSATLQQLAMRQQKKCTHMCTQAAAGDLIKAVRALQSEARLSVTPHALSYSFVCWFFRFDILPSRSYGLPKREVKILLNVLCVNVPPRRIYVEELIKLQVQTHAPSNDDDTSIKAELVKHQLAARRRRGEQPSEARKGLPFLSPSPKGTFHFHFQKILKMAAVSCQSNLMQRSSLHSHIFSSDVMKPGYANVEKLGEPQLKRKQISTHIFCNGTSSIFPLRCSGGGQSLTGPELQCIISDDSRSPSADEFGSTWNSCPATFINREQNQNQWWLTGFRVN